MRNMIRTVKLAMTLGLVACTSAVPANAETAWARCDNCTAWQRSNAAAASVPEVALSRVVNKRVAVVDFETSNHAVLQLTGYFDYELRSYTTQIFQTTPTATETAEFAALESLYRELEPYLSEGSEENDDPSFAYQIPLDSAFDYWFNPGRTNTRILNMIMQRTLVDDSRFDVLDRAKLHVVFTEGSSIRLQAQDGTLVTVTARHLNTGNFAFKDVEFEVTQLQLEDGTYIPLVQSDLDSDWAAVVVNGGNNLMTLVDTLSRHGVSIRNANNSGTIDSSVPRSTIECKKVDGIIECIVTPIPRATE